MRSSKAVLVALGLMACVLSTGCGSQPASPHAAGQVSQLCVPGNAQPTARFGQLRGWITYSEGTQIWAIDPEHTPSRVSLGPSAGVSSITWSRDGSQMLLLETSGTGEATKHDLCVMHADGSLTRLTSDGRSGH